MSEDNNNFKMEVLEQRIGEIRNSCMKNIDKAMTVTADKLESTAAKMHSTAHIIRENNSEKLKYEATEYLKANPKKVIVGAVIVGLLLERIFSK